MPFHWKLGESIEGRGSIFLGIGGMENEGDALVANACNESTATMSLIWSFSFSRRPQPVMGMNDWALHSIKDQLQINSVQMIKTLIEPEALSHEEMRHWTSYLG